MPKVGKNQSVLKQMSSKRKSGFRGTQKRNIRAEKRREISTVGVTFVCEEDVISGQIPPPVEPASSRNTH